MEAQLQQLQAQVQQLQQRPQRVGNHRINKFENSESESWVVWRNHFQNMVLLNEFNDLQARLALSASMSGKAAVATLDIDVQADVNGQPATIERVLGLFQARFLPPAASQLARVKFDGARQNHGETVLNFHSRLRALHNEAYPNAFDEVHLIRKFVQGLRRKDLKMQVMRTSPDTYPEALEAAQNEASVQHLGRLFETGAANPRDEPMDISAMDTEKKTANNNNATTNNSKRKGNCHHCGKPGHWKRDCFKLKDSKGKTNIGRGARVTNLIAALTTALKEGTDAGSGGEDAPSPSTSGVAAPDEADF